MSKFRKDGKKGMPAISTASLPDIVFMLLFFFMVTTVMRETDILVKQKLPKAVQLSKLERKSLVSYIYIGEPKQSSIFGKEPKIQVNDVFVEIDEIILFVNQEKDKLNEAERDQITIAMKVDVESKMGIVSDVQQELREANARKILYSSIQTIDI